MWLSLICEEALIYNGLLAASRVEKNRSKKTPSSNQAINHQATTTPSGQVSCHSTWRALVKSRPVFAYIMPLSHLEQNFAPPPPI